MRIFERLRQLRQSSGDQPATPPTQARPPLDLIDIEDGCCGGCMGQGHGSPAHGEH
jgi:hypothetical protein